MNIFITSPQAKSGKTFISAGFAAIMQALGYKCSYYKPIQSGAEDNFGFLISPDVARVKSVDPYIECLSTYSFKTLAAPSIAAEIEGVNIDTKVILKDYKKLSTISDCNIVEGLDGLMLPIVKGFMMSDLVKLLDLPVLLVVDPQISNIDTILSSLNQATVLGVNVIGIVLNRFPFYTSAANIKSMPRLIEEYSDSKVLGVIGQFDPKKQITPPDLIDMLLNSVDIEKVFNVPLPKLNLGL